MAYKRKIAAHKQSSGADLANDLSSIGINISCEKPSVDPNIEDTLLAASIEAIQLNDGRILALLIDWFEQNSMRINASRFSALLETLDNDLLHVKIFWCANAQRVPTDHRFKNISNLYRGKRFDFLDRNAGESYRSTDFLIQKNGEDERFKDTCIRIPNKMFSHRPHQIFSQGEIARRHMGFRFRVMFGPSFRADAWAELTRHPNLSAYEVAKRTYASYATANGVKQDFETLKTKKLSPKKQ